MAATAALKRAIASSASTPPASCAVRSTRRAGVAEKLLITSPKTLPLPTSVTTLSGVMRVVANRPSSLTVPTMPPIPTKSPTWKGRSTSMKAPAAKLPSMPLQAAPMATPAPAINAAKLVVWMPK